MGGYRVVEVIRIEEMMEDLEEVYERGYGWKKEIVEIRDGLNRIEREVIKVLLKYGGSITGGLLIGELVSRLVYIDIEEIKREVLRMLYQYYPLIERECLIGKPYFTKDKISLTKLGRSFEDVGDVYLKSKIPVYFIQEQVKKWGEGIELVRLSLELKGFLRYLLHVLKGDKEDPQLIKWKLPNRVNLTTIHQFQKYNNIMRPLNQEGRIKVRIQGSYEYDRLRNRLRLYNVMIGRRLEDLLEEISKSPMELEDINIERDGDITIDLMVNRKEITVEEVQEYLRKWGYEQEIEHGYYVLDEDGELILGSWDYLIDYWKRNVENVEEVAKWIEDYLLEIEEEEEKPWIRKWETSEGNWVIVKEDGEVVVSGEREEGKYQFKVKDEDIVLVLDEEHHKVGIEDLEEVVRWYKQKGKRVVGVFPLREKEQMEGIMYFVNQKGYVKVVREKDLWMRGKTVGSTKLEKDENIVKILLNEEGNDKGYLLFITRNGYVKLTHIKELKPKHRASKYIIGMRIDEDDEVVSVYLLKEGFEEVDIIVGNKVQEMQYKVKENELVSSRTNKGKWIRGMYEIAYVDILEEEKIMDKVFK